MMDGNFELGYDADLQSDDKAKKWLAGESSYAHHIIPDCKRLSLDVLDASTGQQKLATIKYYDDMRPALDDDGDSFEISAEMEHRPSHEISVDLGSVHKREIFQFMLWIATELEANGDILAVVESLCTGRTIRRTIEDVVPRCVRLFRFFANVVYDDNTIRIRSEAQRRLVICIPADASLTVLVENLAPAVAMKLDVVVVLDGSQPTIAFGENNETSSTVNMALFYLVEKINYIRRRLPDARTIKLFYIRRSFLEMRRSLAEFTCMATILFTGDSSEATKIAKWISDDESGTLYKPLLLSPCGYMLCVMVFDSSDIDAAVEGVVSALCVTTEQRLQHRLLIQEGIWDAVIKRLIVRLERLRSGNVLDKRVDLGPLTSSGVNQLLEALRAVPPKMREFRGAAGDFLSFRTENEAAQLVNDVALDVRVSVWTEDASLAYRVVDLLLTANVVWINGIELYDAAIPVASNRRLSKNCVVGGLRCAYQQLGYGIDHRQKLREDIVYRKGKQATGDLKSILLAAAAEARKAASSRAMSVEQRKRFLGEALLAISNNVRNDPLGKSSEMTGQFYKCLSYCQTKCGQTEAQEHVQRNNCRGRATVTYRPLGLVLIVCLGDVVQTFLLIALPAIAYGNAVIFINIDTSFSFDNHPVLAPILASAPSNVLKVVTFDQPWNNVLDAVAEFDFDEVFINVDNQKVYNKLDEKNIYYINTEALLYGCTKCPQYFNQRMFFELTRPKSVWETFSNPRCETVS